MPQPRSTRYSPAPYEPGLSRADRRRNGVYYTPPEIARLIVELTFKPLLSPLSPRGRGAGGEGETGVFDQRPLRILDPACGAGEFLVAARDYLASRGHTAARMHGIDIDPQAVAEALKRFEVDAAMKDQIRLGDALAEGAFPPCSFDAVIGNPPYVNIRELARRHSAAEISALREQFQTARGNFDLYVLFIERALEWLSPGGRCGLIVPNKWATLDYARRCRELLLEQATLEQVVDLSSHRVFRDASVYPHVIIFSKRPPAKNAAVRAGGNRLILQRNLSPAAFVLGASLDVESQVATRPLDELALLSCGTPGYAAGRTAAALRERRDAAREDLPFITSGNIDRYQVRIGNVRYQGCVWRDPRLALGAAGASSSRVKLFHSPKIVIAGMSRRLEAAWDGGGLALGVQVFAASEWQVDPFYVLALLNSKLLTYLFRTRFAAKRLSGGYLAINKGQLARLPIALPPSGERKDRRRLNRVAELAASITNGSSQARAADEIAIDQLVYQLYRLDERQIAEVEAHFDELQLPPRAAA